MQIFHVLSLLFVVVYSQGILVRIGLPSFVPKLAIDTCILFMACTVLRRRTFLPAPGGAFVLLFAFWTVISGVVSGDGIYRSILYVRMFAYGYLVFWAVWNASLTRCQIMRVNRLILFLWILQLAAAFFEVLVLGERVEAHVGTIVSGGGGAATAFPLFAMAYVMPFYCYYKRAAWVILLAWSFGIVGYASGKRAIYFLMPAFYALIILWYCLRAKSFARFGRMLKPVMVFALILPVAMYGLTHSKRFERSQGAGVLQDISSTIDTIAEYTFRTYAGGETSGRTSTSLKVLSNLPRNAFSSYLLGLGPTSLMNAGGKRAKESEGIAYGAVGWVRDTVSVGWPAMLLHVGFYLSLWRRLCRRRSDVLNTYAKALHFGCHLGFAAFFLLYFMYLDAFVLAGWFTFVHLYAVAVVISPKNAHLFLRPRSPTEACGHCQPRTNHSNIQGAS